MYRILAEDALAGGQDAIVGWYDGFGGVFACEAGAGGVATAVEDEGVDLIFSDVSIRACWLLRPRLHTASVVLRVGRLRRRKCHAGAFGSMKVAMWSWI